MKRIAMLTIVITSLILTGCATGRVALVDLDMRDKDQIQAYYSESTVPYVTASTNGLNNSNAVASVTSSTATVGLTPWEYIFDFLKISHMRIRVISLEWRN